jgi:AcrR family transcriptional regulator
MSNPSPPSLRERKKAATRERLLAAANELFVARGYDATTMDDIAARADVARATAFNYFPRKDDFLRAWIDGRRRAIADLLAAEQARPVPTAERLRHALMELCAMLERDAGGNRALLRAWVRAGGQLQPDASATAELFAATLRFGQARGDVRAGVDADVAGRLLLDAYAGTIIRWAAGADGLAGAVGAALDLVLAGLRSE